MKKKKLKHRSALCLLAKCRTSAGPMKLKKHKRINGKNKQEEFLKEDF